MPMNMIQFQPGLCLTEFLQQFGTEAKNPGGALPLALAFGISLP